jgi:hypothetical protein
MIRWCNRRTLTAIPLVAGVVMLQGSLYNPSESYPTYGGHGYVTPMVGQKDAM